MPSRSELHQRFAERFRAGKRIRPATEAQVEAAESALGVLWPDSYRRFVLSCGALYTPSILTLIVASHPGYSDVQQFFTPRQSVVETRRFGQAPGASVVIGYDSSGNLFALRGLPASPPRPDDAEVWLFDHEEDAVAVDATSFDEWLGRYLSL